MLVVASERVTVLLVGHKDPTVAEALIWRFAGEDEEDGFTVLSLADDEHIARVVAEARPHVIFTFGDLGSYPRLHAAPLETRRRWTHFEDPPSAGSLAERALAAFVDISTNDRFPSAPLVSVCTVADAAGEVIRRPLASLLNQTYTNWEWVVLDCSPPDHHETWRQLCWYAGHEPRIRVARVDGSSRRAGARQREAFGLAGGSVLVELNHDDELTDHIIADIVEGFERFPDAGFAYSDLAEVFPDGSAALQPEGWGFGYGGYRDESYRGALYAVTNYPSVNPKTIRHSAGAPSRVRAWRRLAYSQIGGHSPDLHVADDYDLVVRTFLATRLLHIRRFGYIQHLREATGFSQVDRNRETQRVVRLLSAHYEDAIHRRITELGAEDYLRPNGALDWSVDTPPDETGLNFVLS